MLLCTTAFDPGLFIQVKYNSKQLFHLLESKVCNNSTISAVYRSKVSIVCCIYRVDVYINLSY